MQSLPLEAKVILMNTKKLIHYSNQLLKIDTTTGCADSWSPSADDIFARDWQVKLSEDYVKD